jgi:myosin heavy subunit
LGARVKNYLLEKSRVIGPAKAERNYHVFYHLLRGAPEELANELGLLDFASKKRFDIPDFNYLKNGGDVD